MGKGAANLRGANSYSGRTCDECKKIGLKDAFHALYCIVRCTSGKTDF